MQMSAGYLEFRNQLSSLRVDSLVAGATAWARNQPSPSEIDTTALVSRVARNRGLNPDIVEVAEAAQRVKQGLVHEIA